MALEIVDAFVIGVLQGVLEWLPVSSEGMVSLYLSFAGTDPAEAVKLSLFLHGGTAVSAATYYRGEILRLAESSTAWRPGAPFSREYADLSFLVGATLVSGVVGATSYILLMDLASELAGGLFVALIGLMLLVTGVVQRAAEEASGGKNSPSPASAVIVGVLQGLAILPGVSRSGTTVSGLLLLGHDGPSALRLSFLLSVPAAIGAGILTGTDGTTLKPITASVALITSAVVGYLSIDVLMKLVEEVPFWAVCVIIGGLAVIGGLLSLVL